MLPKTVCILLKTSYYDGYVFEFVSFLLLVFHNFLETSRRFTLKIDSDIRDYNVRDIFISPN
jgi:hypothetical protein